MIFRGDSFIRYDKLLSSYCYINVFISYIADLSLSIHCHNFKTTSLASISFTFFIFVSLNSSSWVIFACTYDMNGSKNTNSHVKINKKTAKAKTPHYFLVIGAKVALEGRIFSPVWGLRNGSCGIIKEIGFDDGKFNNREDRPLYVVVDFPLYCEPVHASDNRFSSTFLPP